MRRLKEMLQFAVILDSCLHVKLTNRFREPSKKRKLPENIDQDAACGDRCSYCCRLTDNKNYPFHPVHREGLIDTLDSLFCRGAQSVKAISNKMFENKSEIWTQTTIITRENVDATLLQLLAKDIIAVDVEQNITMKKNAPDMNISLRWARLFEPTSKRKVAMYDRLHNIH